MKKNCKKEVKGIKEKEKKVYQKPYLYEYKQLKKVMGSADGGP